MRYLTIGDRVRTVTDEVARSWDAVAARAQHDAAQYGGYPVVHVRTERHGFGSIPIHPDIRITITEEGQSTEPDLGVIVQASSDVDEIHAAIVAERGPEPERSDAEVEELVREMKADRPDLDWDNLLMGRLAGPESPDGPTCRSGTSSPTSTATRVSTSAS